MIFKSIVKVVATLCIVLTAGVAIAAPDCDLMLGLANSAYKGVYDADVNSNRQVAYAYSRSFWNIYDAVAKQCKPVADLGAKLNAVTPYSKDAQVPAEKLAQFSSLINHVKNTSPSTPADYLTWCLTNNTCQYQTAPSATFTGRKIDKVGF